MSPKLDFIIQLGELTIGTRLKRLSDKINKDISRIFRLQKISLEPSWLPVALYLQEIKSATILDIAGVLKFTHPAAIHLVNQMEKNNLVEAFRDDNDKRKRLIRLSKSGEEMLNNALPVFEEIRNSVKEIYDAAGTDFLNTIDFIEKTLNSKSLGQRINDRLKNKLIDSIDIIRYSPALKNDFKNLNNEWLIKYFNVEKEDERILNNPGKIIDDGGEIFFAKIKNEIIGTCAVIKISGDEFELAKMAVTEKAQGKQAGKKLALTAIGYAYSQGAKILSLETSRKLNSALNLYEKLGFEYTARETASKYERETIKMKLDLLK